MRSDWPVVPDEDCIEPPCEIFLQLFIQNVEMAVDDNTDDNNDDSDFLLENAVEFDEHNANELLQNFGTILEDDIFSDDSEDSVPLSISPPSVTTDPELSPSHEEETELECEESNNDAHCIQDSDSSMSQNSEESWFVEFVPNNESEQQESVDVESVCDAHPSSEPSPSEIIADVHSWLESSDEMCHSNGFQTFEEVNDENSSKGVSLSSGMSQLEESSSGNNTQPSTHVSLYVVVPPSNFFNETDTKLLPEVSTDLSELIPINPSYCQEQSCLKPDNESFQLDNASVYNSTKIHNSDELATSSTLVLPDTTSRENNQRPNVSHIDFTLESSVSDSKSETICFYDRESDLLAYNTALSEETGILEKTSSNELDKSVLSLKRKGSSVEDNSLNKVPRYSSSQTTSNDSANHVSLDKLSNNSERQTPLEGDKIDIVPSTDDNVILTLGKSIEQASVVSEKTKNL